MMNFPLPGEPTAVFIRTNERGQVVLLDPSGRWELFVMSPEQAEQFAEALRQKAEEARKSQLLQSIAKNS
jgi:hypothetical protein